MPDINQYYLLIQVPEKAKWSIAASSVYGNDNRWAPEKAIDEVELPNNAFVTISAAHQWLCIDFGTTVKVYQMEVLSRIHFHLYLLAGHQDRQSGQART